MPHVTGLADDLAFWIAERDATLIGGEYGVNYAHLAVVDRRIAELVAQGAAQVDLSAVSLPAGSVLVAVPAADGMRNDDLYAYGACGWCLTEMGRLMCGCDSPLSFVCVSAQGARERGLTPILSAPLPAPRVGLTKLWDCCRRNPVATAIMMTSDGYRVTYPLCGSCAYSYARCVSRDEAAELYGIEPVSAPIAPAAPTAQAPAVELRKAQAIMVDFTDGQTYSQSVSLPTLAIMMREALTDPNACEIHWQADRLTVTFAPYGRATTHRVTYALPSAQACGAIRTDIACEEIAGLLSPIGW